MEGKSVMLSVFIMSLVIAQTQVEAKLCCPSTTARIKYNTCRTARGSRAFCARLSGCQFVSGTCPGGYTNDVLENYGDAFNEYCKLGCASSVCGAMSTLENSDASEIVKGAVDECTKACSVVCNKGSMTAIKTA